MECAKLISTHFNLEELIKNSIYIIPNTHNIYIDYEIIKIYLTSENSNSITNYIIFLMKLQIDTYNTFNIHINLNTFSISAAERYKYAIESFFENCKLANTNYSTILNKLYLYNKPSVIDTILTILKPFIVPDLYGKLVFYDKVESAQLLNNLLSTL